MVTAKLINELPTYTKEEVEMLLKTRPEWAVFTVARAEDSLEVLFTGELKPMAVVAE